MVSNSHPILLRLRKEAKRGNEIVIYRHGLAGTFVLAETDGRITREIEELKGFPHISLTKIRELAARLRPVPGRHKTRMELIGKEIHQKRERSRNFGRFKRELMVRIRRKLHGTKRDHPSIAWPYVVKGEGV